MPDIATSGLFGAAGTSDTVALGSSPDQGLAAARAAEDRGDTKEALRILAMVRREFPDHAAAYHQAGLALLQLNRLDEGTALLEDARTRFPGDIGIAIAFAREADRQGDHEQSVARWEYVIEHFPTYAVGYFNLGLSLRRAGKFIEADPAMQAAAERFPDYADAAIEYARLADARKDWPEAAKRWEQVRSRFPNHGAGYLDAAASARSAGEPDAEDQIFDLTLSQFAGNFDIVSEFLRHASGNGDWPRVLRRWQKVRALFSDRPICYTSLGHALRMLQRLDEADAVLSEGILHCPTDPDIAAAHAWMAFYRRDWTEAVQRWEAVRQRHPELLAGFIGLAAAFGELQRYDEADPLLEEAFRRFPHDPHPLIDRVWLALKRRDWPETVRRGADARALVPRHPAGYSGPGIALREMGQFDEADIVLEEAIRLMPDWGPFAYEYADVARARGDMPELLTRLKAAHARFPADINLSRQIADVERLLATIEEEERIAAAWDVPEAEKQKKYLFFSSSPSGLGHLCSAMLYSAYYAYKTGRTLVLDMSLSLYYDRNQHESFFDHFSLEFPPELEVIIDRAEIERIKNIPDRIEVAEHRPLEISRPIKNTVLAVPNYTPGSSYRLDVKRLDLPFRIVPKGPLADGWNEVKSMPQWNGPVIGLHFRALLGEITSQMNPVIVPDFDARCDAIRERYIETALAIVRDEGYENPAFFVASEDARFVDIIKQRLPNCFSIATRLPNIPGQSFVQYIQHHGYDLSILIDTANDVWCLSECDHLIHNRSGFANFALLNSRKMDKRHSHAFDMPRFGDVLQTLPPETAVEWARNALRKLNTVRVRDPYFHDVAAIAYDRAGESGEAVLSRNRIRWFQEMDRPVPAAPRGTDEPADVALARQRAAIYSDNPYVFAGYGNGLSDILVRHGRIDDAVAASRRAVELDPSDPYLHAHLGVILKRVDAVEAERALRRAVELEPDVYQFHVEWGEALAQLQRWDGAIEAMRSAVALDPASVASRARLGELLLAVGRNLECEQILREAIALFPDHLRLDHVLSIALDRQNRVEEAIVAARRVQELDPGNAGWPLYVGGMLQRIGQLDEAEQAYRQALDLDPASDAARAALESIKAARRS